jgi:hypothetical protein
LWNLVADETREGDVYRTLLDKLEQGRQTLGGTVFTKELRAAARRYVSPLWRSWRDCLAGDR